MKINTKDLQAMVSKVQKGAVPNGILPITGLINIRKGKEAFEIRTFDGICHYKSSLALASDDGFVACVNASLFANLVAKTTSQEVELTSDGKSLSFKGNGSYELEIVYDNGVPLDFPTLERYEGGAETKIRFSLKALSEAFSSCEVTMAKNVADYPLYSAMSVSDKCVSTNNNIACVHSGSVYAEGAEAKDALIPYPALNFLSSFDDAEIEMAIVESDKEPTFRLYDSNFAIYGPIAPKYKSYPAKRLEDMLSGNCKKVAIKVQDALGAIERTLLFSKQNNDFGIVLSFHDSVISISCLKDAKKIGSLSEEIDVYEIGPDGLPTESSALIEEPIETPLNILYLQSELKALDSVYATIGFGFPKFVTVSGGNDVFMLSFLALKK